MCRAGGRRCPGSGASSRLTQNARQQRSRANRALRAARAAGDEPAIQRAQQRLDAANAILKRHKENHVSNNNESDGHRPQHNEESARQHGDVTNEHEPVEPRQGVPFVLHNTNIAEPGANVGSQTDVNHDTVHFHVRQGPAGDVTAKVQRAMERARKAQQYAAGTTGADSEQGHTVHIGPKDPNTGARSVNVATSDGHTRLQIGRHYGDVWINGERAD